MTTVPGPDVDINTLDFLVYDPTNFNIYHSKTGPAVTFSDPYGPEAPSGADWPPLTQNKPNRPPEAGDLYMDLTTSVQYFFNGTEWVQTKTLPLDEITVRYDLAGAATGPTVTFDGTMQPLGPVVTFVADANARGASLVAGDIVIATEGTYHIDVDVSSYRDWTLFTPELGTPAGSIVVTVNGAATDVKQTLRPMYPGYQASFSGYLFLKVGDTVSLAIDGNIFPRDELLIDNISVALGQTDQATIP